MQVDSELRYVRRTMTGPSFLMGGGFSQKQTWFEWWSKESGWTRDPLEAEIMTESEARDAQRQLRLENDPNCIFIAVFPIKRRV
jgi:hypothetical protein